jgi:hypothetical protein
MINDYRKIILNLYTVEDVLDWYKRQNIERVLINQDNEYQEAFIKELKTYEQ